jgi:hypothetical protein
MTTLKTHGNFSPANLCLNQIRAQQKVKKYELLVAIKSRLGKGEYHSQDLPLRLFRDARKR